MRVGARDGLTFILSLLTVLIAAHIPHRSGLSLR
jgi:hypothetical protein